MHVDASLSDMLRLFFNSATTDEAFTLIKRVQIANLIVDSQFLLGTPAALRLYGRTATEFQTWQSLTQPLIEFQRSRAIATARHIEPEIPSRYITKIVHPSGEVIPVVKDTQEIVLDGESHWLTHLKLASETPDVIDSESIAIPSHALNEVEFRGLYSLAEVYQVLQDRGVSQEEELHDRHTESIIDDLRICDEAKPVDTTTEAGVHLQFGEPVVCLPSGQYIFECQSCAWIWTPRKREGKKWSEVKNAEDFIIPDRCGNPNRRCYNWKEGGVHGKSGPKPQRS